jgi:hypothetical protein
MLLTDQLISVRKATTVFSGDGDGLRVVELAHARGGELVAVASALDAAEGQTGVAGDHAVEGLPKTAAVP